MFWCVWRAAGNSAETINPIINSALERLIETLNAAERKVKHKAGK